MSLLTKTFNGAQVFYVDPTIVGGERTCNISSIDLYFKFKPDISLNLTNSAAGVSLFIAETKFSTPSITRDSGIFTGQISRVPFSDILTSSDATVPTTFRFNMPVTVETDKEYCFVISFELLSQYELWKSVQGEVLTGTTKISPGPSSQFIGQFFDSTSVFVAEDNTNLDEYLKNWRALSDTSLKFDIKIARYAHSGVPVYSNTTISNDDIISVNPKAIINTTSTGINFNVNFGSYEYISFDENKSDKSAFIGGMLVFQNTFSYPGGSLGSHSINIQSSNAIITANTNLPNGDPFQWSNIFTTSNIENGLVLTDGTNFNVRKVHSITSNTVLVLDEPVTFTNTSATMMITPIGRISSFNKDSPFGVDDAFIMLANSTANSTVRFVNNDIESVAITAGGTGYSNSDLLHIIGFEEVTGKVSGGYKATANVSTNTTGGITSFSFSNLGCGFVNSNAITPVVANGTSGNTTANTSAGSGLTLTYDVGAVLKSEYGSSVFRDCKVRNLDIGEFIPFSNIEVPTNMEYSLKLETNYLRLSDSSTYSGDVYYVNSNASNNQLEIVMYDLNSTESLSYTPAIPSKSNEFNIKYQDGSPNDKLSSNAASRNSESLRIVSDITANSDFNTVRMSRPVIQFSKYIINNDATDEHTDSGNAYAKGITKTIAFTRTAEDLRIYLTAYKPANTDILVYARIYKNEDPDAFDDKNWTQLELKSGVGLQSSMADPLDYVELEYGFYQVPNARTTLTGSVSIASADATVTGEGTDFVTDLAVGDLVYMYQPLFVDNHIVVAVDSITNATSFEMDTTTSNTSLITSGMQIEKVTYPRQGFNNIQNDNLVRYYNKGFSKFDGYETMAVKIVFLSDSPHKIPRVDDLKGVAVSA